MNYQPGIYECISKVKIRKEPKVVEYVDKDKKFITNAVGQLDIGTQRQIYSIVTDNYNVTWGRTSESDAAGISQWVCIKGLNREYMKPLGTTFDVNIELYKLIQWAKTKGYMG